MTDFNNGNVQQPQQENRPPIYNPPPYPAAPQGVAPPEGYPQRSRMAAGIFAILLGVSGIHSFYLGNASRGLMQLLISALTLGIGAIVMAIWGILDGIKILDGRINVDANGVFLKD